MTFLFVSSGIVAAGCTYHCYCSGRKRRTCFAPIALYSLAAGSLLVLDHFFPRNLVFKPAATGNNTCTATLVNMSNRSSSVGGKRPIGAFAVGLRRIIGSNSTYPAMTVFYPTARTTPLTLTSCCRSDTDEGHGGERNMTAESLETSMTNATVGPWLAGNDRRYADGLAQYIKIPSFLLARSFLSHRVAALENVPWLGCAQSLVPSDCPEVYIMSHGLAGNQCFYSTYCMDLASSGAVVLALEHNDGSATFAQARDMDDTCTDAVGGGGGDGGNSKGAFYQMPPADEKQKDLMRQEQLRFRVSEVQRAIDFALDGRLTRLLSEGKSVEGSQTKNSTPRFSAPRIHLAGHSFGAATAVATALKESQTPSALPHRQIQTLTALDIWCDPLQLQGSGTTSGSGPAQFCCDWGAEVHSPLPPLKLLDSEHWERWVENVEEEKQLMEQWERLSCLSHNTCTGAAVARADCIVSRDWLRGTDHYALSDLGLFIHPRFRRQYATLRREAIQYWAEQTVDHLAE